MVSESLRHARPNAMGRMNVGMGARGLSFAAICTELLAAQLGSEPWPLPHNLARGLDVQRVISSG